MHPALFTIISLVSFAGSRGGVPLLILQDPCYSFSRYLSSAFCLILMIFVMLTRSVRLLDR